MSAGRFFINETNNNNNWLKVRLTSKKKTINRFAVGAQVRVTLKDGKILTRQVESGTGQGNQNDLVLHFGLGSNDQPVNLNVFWPDGSSTELKETPINQKIEINTEN